MEDIHIIREVDQSEIDKTLVSFLEQSPLSIYGNTYILSDLAYRINESGAWEMELIGGSNNDLVEG